MAFGHGIAADFDFAGGSIKAYINSIDPTFTRELAELRVLGATAHYVAKLAGFMMGTIAVDGEFDPTLDAAAFTAFESATATAWAYYPQGNSGSNIRYSGSCWVSQYKPGPAGDSSVKATFSLECTGQITRDTCDA